MATWLPKHVGDRCVCNFSFNIPTYILLVLLQYKIMLQKIFTITYRKKWGLSDSQRHENFLGTNEKFNDIKLYEFIIQNSVLS